MQFGERSLRFVSLLGAILLLIIGIGFVLAMERSRGVQTASYASGSVKIHVDEDGLYRISLVDLWDAKSLANAESGAAINLTTRGVQVPYFIDSDGLYFYGVAPTSRYLSYKPYLLTIGEPGLLMEEIELDEADGDPISMIPRTVHLQENNIYDSRSVEEDVPYPNFEDPWYWSDIQHGEEVRIEFELEHVDESSPAVLRTALFGATSIPSVNPDHDIALVLNDIVVDSISWDGETHKMTETVLEPGVLRDGNNVLVFDNHSVTSEKNSGQESIVPIDIMRLDWIEVDFNGFPRVIEDSILLNGVSGDVRIEGFSEKPIIIDISNPDAPKQVIVAAADDNVLDASIPAGLVLYAAGEEAVQSKPKIESVHNGMLSNPATQADLIILTTSELSPTMTSLADWRREQGLSVTVVDVADVYNEFGAGEESPESITAFLEYALSTWQPPSPQYLLIVGDASYDYRNYLGQSNSNLIPSPMVRVAYGGETVSDANMADIDSDGWPDIAVGRWPVRNANQAEDLIDRTIAYEKEASSGRVLLAADGTSTEFSSLSDSVLKESNLPEDSAVKLYGATTAEFTEAWNEGAWLVSYAGHGSIDRWGKEGVFSAEGVPNLNAEGSPPVVIQLTCLTGYYAHPEVESISESLLQHQSGPVEIIAATSLTLSSNQKPFGVAFFREMQQDENYRIGDALQKAKLSLDVEHSRALKEISETFTLLGDPSALIARPQR